jgi:NAD(P)-dependent dehydrogenase (short-subunit alcohol dehydrogenase family)
MACDVTDKSAIDAVVAITVAEFGGISTLVNNVGWGGRQEDPASIPEEEFLASYKLNTISAYRMSANAMLWLCSPAGGWLSGQTISVHGGGNVVRLFGQ